MIFRPPAGVVPTPQWVQSSSLVRDRLANNPVFQRVFLDDVFIKRVVAVAGDTVEVWPCPCSSLVVPSETLVVSTWTAAGISCQAAGRRKAALSTAAAAAALRPWHSGSTADAVVHVSRCRSLAGNPGCTHDSTYSVQAPTLTAYKRSLSLCAAVQVRRGQLVVNGAPRSEPFVYERPLYTLLPQKARPPRRQLRSLCRLTRCQALLMLPPATQLADTAHLAYLKRSVSTEHGRKPQTKGLEPANRCQPAMSSCVETTATTALIPTCGARCQWTTLWPGLPSNTGLSTAWAAAAITRRSCRRRCLWQLRP